MQVRDPITVQPGTSITEARALMARERIRHLLVAEGGRLLGIVTDRDIRLNLPSPATSLSVWEINYLLQRLTVGEVMTRTLITVDPDRPVAGVGLNLLEEAAELPLGPADFDALVISHEGDPGRVVAPVLEFSQPLEQKRGRVPVAHITDDSAHEGIPFSSSCSFFPCSPPSLRSPSGVPGSRPGTPAERPG